MGVAGCGKTSVGLALAESGLLAFIDGDDLHPPQNIQKMSEGIPLEDADREPWLVLVGQALADARGPVAIGCSALKRKYRDLISQTAGEEVGFIHLSAAKDVIANRMASRINHFMPRSLLESQFSALEPLEKDEHGFVVDISGSIADIVADIKNKLVT